MLTSILLLVIFCSIVSSLFGFGLRLTGGIFKLILILMVVGALASGFLMMIVPMILVVIGLRFLLRSI